MTSSSCSPESMGPVVVKKNSFRAKKGRREKDLPHDGQRVFENPSEEQKQMRPRGEEPTLIEDDLKVDPNGGGPYVWEYEQNEIGSSLDVYDDWPYWGSDD